MSKIGVGIGEEFPADDSKSAEAPEGDRRKDERDAECAKRHEAYRKWREQRRQWRKEWRKEWRERSRAFQHELSEQIQENVRHNVRESIRRSMNGKSADYFHDDGRASRHHDEWSQWVLWAILGIIAAIALVSFVFSNVYLVVGVVALLALIADYYRGQGPFATSPAGEAVQ